MESTASIVCSSASETKSMEHSIASCKAITTVDGNLAVACCPKSCVPRMNIRILTDNALKHTDFVAYNYRLDSRLLKNSTVYYAVLYSTILFYKSKSSIRQSQISVVIQYNTILNWIIPHIQLLYNSMISK